jgi:hypothetical protein
MSSVLRSTGKTTLVGTLVDAFRSRGESHRLTRSEPEYGHSFTIQKLASARAVAAVTGQPSPRSTS